MKKSLTLLVGLMLSTLTFSQEQGFNWANKIETLGFSGGKEIKSMPNGDIYTLISFSADVSSSTISGLPNYTYSGSGDDHIILKQNSNGTYVWSKHFTSDNQVVTFEVDNSGNVFIVSNFGGTVDFNPDGGTSNLTANSGDLAISKFNSNGTFQWVKQLGGDNIDLAKSSAVDDSGNIFVLGEYKDEIDVDPNAGVVTLYSNGNNGNTISLYNNKYAFIAKLDPNGNYLSSTQIGNSTSDANAVSIIVHNGEILANVISGNGMDFDPTSGNSNGWGLNGYAIGYYSMDLVLNNVRSKPSQYHQQDIITDASDNLYFVTNYQHEDTMTVVKINSSENIVWENKEIHGTTNTQLVNLSISSNGDLTCAMRYYGDIYQNNTQLYSTWGDGNWHTVLTTFNTNGNLTWVKNCPAYFMDIDASNNQLLSSGRFTNGSFDNDVDFNVNSGEYLMDSGFISGVFFNLKMSPCTENNTNQNITACNSYYWEANSQTYTQSGTHQAILTNQSGCDSTVTLNLTIYNLNTDIINDNGTLLAVETNQSYQWLDCNDNYLEINGENFESFQPTQNGSYAVEISNGSCVDTSICEVINTIGLEELSKITIEFYPNPTTGKVFFNEMIDFVEIRNISGKLIITKRNIKELDLSDLPKGIYFLHPKTKHDTNQTIKVILK